MHESWHDLGKVPSSCELLSYALPYYRNIDSPDRIRQFQDYWPKNELIYHHRKLTVIPTLETIHGLSQGRAAYPQSLEEALRSRLVYIFDKPQEIIRKILSLKVSLARRFSLAGAPLREHTVSRLA